MRAIWNRVEDTFERIDHYTYGAAEMLLIMVLGGTVAVGFYLTCAAVVWGYIQLFNLLSGNI